MSNWKEHHCVLPAFRKKIPAGLVVDHIKIVNNFSKHDVGFTRSEYKPGDDSVDIELDEYGRFECTFEAHQACAGMRNGAAETIKFTLMRIALEPVDMASKILFRRKPEDIFALPLFFTGGESDVDQLPLFKRSLSDFNSYSEGYTFKTFPVATAIATNLGARIEQYLVEYRLQYVGSPKGSRTFYVLALTDAAHPKYLHLFASCQKRYLERERMVRYLKKHKDSDENRPTREERRVAVEAYLTAALTGGIEKLSQELEEDEVEAGADVGAAGAAGGDDSNGDGPFAPFSAPFLDSADAGATGAAGAGVDGNNGDGPSAPFSAPFLEGADAGAAGAAGAGVDSNNGDSNSSHKRKLEQLRSGDVDDPAWRRSMQQALRDTDASEAIAAIPEMITNGARALAAVLGNLELLKAGAAGAGAAGAGVDGNNGDGPSAPFSAPFLEGADAGAAGAGVDGNNGDGPSAPFSAPFLEGAALESRICETTLAVSQFVAAMRQKAASNSSHKRKLEQLRSGDVDDPAWRRSMQQALRDTDVSEAIATIPETIAISARALTAVLRDLELLKAR
ncbi:hypothetical protein T492DRAFT_1020475 [Pavlovales sp. CCMP2436]|nr:hypothetical protein T492DRAFT_1020475 [Pavlovales sp. CCMP2436]